MFAVNVRLIELLRMAPPWRPAVSTPTLLVVPPAVVTADSRWLPLIVTSIGWLVWGPLSPATKIARGQRRVVLLLKVIRWPAWVLRHIQRGTSSIRLLSTRKSEERGSVVKVVL